MNIGIVGAGDVARTLAGKFSQLGHCVKISNTRGELASQEQQWMNSQRNVSIGSPAQAAAFGELVVVAVPGRQAVEAVRGAGQENFTNKTVIDTSNALVGSEFKLFTGVDDSIAEAMQRCLPTAHVVKAFNVMHSALMVDPSLIRAAEPAFLLCGNFQQAKEQVRQLVQSMGWALIYDLGDLQRARAMETYMLMWMAVFPLMKTPDFAIQFLSAPAKG